MSAPQCLIRKVKATREGTQQKFYTRNICVCVCVEVRLVELWAYHAFL